MFFMDKKGRPKIKIGRILLESLGESLIEESSRAGKKADLKIPVLKDGKLSFEATKDW